MAKSAAIDSDMFASTERPVDASIDRQVDSSISLPVDKSIKVKMAFHLSPEVAAALERRHAEQRATATGDRRKVSRSAIVERALRAWLGLDSER